jgi:hypothetical protein
MWDLRVSSRQDNSRQVEKASPTAACVRCVSLSSVEIWTVGLSLQMPVKQQAPGSYRENLYKDIAQRGFFHASAYKTPLSRMQFCKVW